jgi:[protein-PII] uridylyltransferase
MMLTELAKRSHEVDEVVRKVFGDTLQTSSLSVAAVGGYGRSELFPFSDIDLLILTPGVEVPKPEREAIAAFLQALWDSGLRLSQSVRTVEECLTLHENNVELNSSLLDHRFLSGDSTLYGRFSTRQPDFLRKCGAALAHSIADLTRIRHGKFQGTIYHLEPDLKDAPGGLRDVHVVRWLRRLQAENEEGELTEAFGLLVQLRLGLHKWAKRDNNILSFEAQDVLTAESTKHARHFATAEDLMRDYYRQARVVVRAAVERVELAESRDGGLISQFRSWRSRLSTSEFTVARERVLARSPQLLESDTGLVLRLFEFIGRHGLSLAADTERRLMHFEPAGEIDFKWPHVESLLVLPKVAAALRSMNETHVLRKLLPEWAGVECLVVRDFFHRYTVDEHTVVAIELLENLRDDRFDNLLEETGRTELLRAALLLHDTGKGAARELAENHEIRSVLIAKRVLDRWQVDEADRAVILFLVEHHLVLSNAMTKRDLGDPATARELAERVGTIENLKLLTLLTYADISAVAPGAMTPWRLEQLWRTYLVVQEELTRDLEERRIHSQESRSPEEAAFLEGLPTRYARTHTEAQIQAHVRLSQSVAETGSAISLERIHSVWQVVAIAKDRPFLFAPLAGAIASFGMNIVKAEAFSNNAGLAVDTFVFEDPHRTLELNPEEVTRMKKTLTSVASGKEDVRKLLARRRPVAGKKSRVEPRVLLKNDAVPSATLLEIVSEDRPGLLHELSSAISRAGCDIEVVLIDTEAHRALDVFYLKYGDGKLPEELHESLRDELMVICSEA